MTRLTILLGGKSKPGLARLIAQGQHPDVDYLGLLGRGGTGLLSFDHVENAAARTVRALAHRAGPYWALAALARQQPGTLGTALAMGEDVGLPMALLQRATLGASPTFIITHGSYLASRKAAVALGVLRMAPHVHFLCLSETLRRRLIERHRLPAARVLNAGYGVDTRFFRPDPSVPVDPRQVASAGTANRDYRTLVAAVTRLDASVKIAADSAWFRTGLDIDGMALPSNVEARSHGDYVGLRRLYARSAFVVVPLYEAVHACGYAVIAEAMAMGKPVIATKTVSHSDYIVEGETGFHVPPGDVQALRERIAYLLERPDVAAEMGRNARRLMEERFTLDAYTRRIVAATGLALPEARPADGPEAAAKDGECRAAPA